MVKKNYIQRAEKLEEERKLIAYAIREAEIEEQLDLTAKRLKSFIRRRNYLVTSIKNNGCGLTHKSLVQECGFIDEVGDIYLCDNCIKALKICNKLNSEKDSKTCATKHVIPPKSKDSGILPNFT